MNINTKKLHRERSETSILILLIGIALLELQTLNTLKKSHREHDRTLFEIWALLQGEEDRGLFQKIIENDEAFKKRKRRRKYRNFRFIKFKNPRVIRKNRIK